MNETTVDQIRAAALALPDSERAELEEELLVSLEPPGTPISSAELEKLVKDRYEKYLRGELESFSEEEVYAMVKKHLMK